MNEQLRERVGQAIHDAIQSGAPTPDWNDAREIDRLADAAITAMQADEMKELLHSTHEIALRAGADTHWESLAKSIAKLGIAPITARHYFAEDTSREAINKHLDALASRINAARATGVSK